MSNVFNVNEVLGNNVELGDNNTITRGTLGDTIIGDGVKTDCGVHIAHNSFVGKNSMLAAHAMISGSVTIGADVQIGGQVGIAQHVTIGDGAVLTARSGVTKDVLPNAQMAGFPAVEAGQYWREVAALRRVFKSSGATRKNTEQQ